MILEVRDVSMEFGSGTKALQDVNLKVRQGSVHGVIGENGAGKSTLIKIISAALIPTKGQLLWRNDAVKWNGPVDARRAGIRTIYQDIPLVPTLSVLENVFLDQGGILRRQERSKQRFSELLARVGYEIDPERKVGSLPIGERQMVAILQALSGGAELIIMDEPTASLSSNEREVIFKVIRRLSKSGTTFLYISHFLDEILKLTDAVTALRDGRVTLNAKTSDMDYDAIVEAVAGRALILAENTLSKSAPVGPVVLEVEHLGASEPVRDVSFTVRAGEVVGLAGLLGSGRSELLRAIFGADARLCGTVRVNGGELPAGTPAAVGAGLSFVPEDRRDGAIADWPIWMNCSLPYLADISVGRLVPRRAAERERAERLVTALNIRAPDVDTPVRDLSGGNAQKVVVAKWFNGAAIVFLFDDPTVGVDIAAKTEIINFLRGLAADGKAVIVASSDFLELIAVSDRILIMRNGQIVTERSASSTSEPELLGLVGGWVSNGGEQTELEEPLE